MNIEFFGLSGSGKTTLANFLKRKFIFQYSSYRNLYLKELYNKKNIGIINFINLLIKESIRENFNNRKKNKNFKKKTLFTTRSIQENVDKVFYKKELEKTKYFEYMEYLNNKHKQHSLENVLNWIKIDLIGFHLKEKSKKNIFINSEGFAQRLLSVVMRLPLTENEISELLKLSPKSDILILLKKRNVSLKNFKKKNINEPVIEENIEFLFREIHKFYNVLDLSNWDLKDKKKKLIDIIK